MSDTLVSSRILVYQDTKTWIQLKADGTALKHIPGARIQTVSYTSALPLSW